MAHFEQEPAGKWSREASRRVDTVMNRERGQVAIDSVLMRAPDGERVRMIAAYEVKGSKAQFWRRLSLPMDVWGEVARAVLAAIAAEQAAVAAVDGVTDHR